MEMQGAWTSIDRFRVVTREEFGREVNAIWEAAAELKDAIVERVESGALPTGTGLGMIACITGQAFGYAEFHGQPTPADLLSELTYRSRETAHSRP